MVPFHGIVEGNAVQNLAQDRVRATFPHYRVPNPKGARSSTLWIQARYVKLAGRRTFGVGKA
jgi:hypothetical protein